MSRLQRSLIRIDFIAERITAHALDRLEGSMDRQLLALSDIRMTPRENIHARLLAETERFVLITPARGLRADVLGGAGDRDVLAVELRRVGEKLGWGRLSCVSEGRTNRDVSD